MSQPRFNLKNKKAKSSLIILVYRINGKKIVHSTGMSVYPPDWNDRIMRVRTTAGNFESEIINNELDLLDALVREIHRDFRLRRIEPTVKEFKDLIAKGGSRTESLPVKSTSFTQFMDQFIRERTESPKFREGSVKVYKTTRNHFKRYCGHRVIEFEDLTREYLEGFINYLYRKNYADNHVNKIMGTMRTMLNDAWERRLHRNDAYKSKRLMVSKRQADNVYLSEAELQKLEELDLEGEPTLERVRDLFLIAAYTGLRFTDFVNLHPGNIIEEDGQMIFEVNTQKTDEKVFIPVHLVVKKILDRHDGPPGGISNQKLNEYIKEVCKRAKIKEMVTKRTYRGGTRQEETFEKYELVSSHTGRRSFATNAYKAGLDSISIMKITGHKTPEQFMKYIKVDKKENAVRMAGHRFFR